MFWCEIMVLRECQQLDDSYIIVEKMTDELGSGDA